MKIQIENNNVCVTVDTNRNFYNKKDMLDICDKVYDTILSATEKEEPWTNNNNDVTIALLNNKEELKSSTSSEKETLLIRPRIPNNVVDVKDLTIEQAVTEKALVRCPKCGQSHILAVNSGDYVYMMRKFYSLTASDDFRIIAEFDSLNNTDLINMCCKPETNRKAYFEDIQKIKMIDDKDFVVNNNTEIFCPVCCKSDTFMNWKEAFKNPLQYFETEQLCDACGGEKLEKLIRKHKVYQCDKCGLQTDFKEE